MAVEKGAVSVQMENLFPLIKKWLYSEKDIFVRELITNGLDAINKIKRLKSLGEFKTEEEEQYEIHVAIDREKKTLTFSDNGIGMTAEEIKKYISEVAFSGANDFLSKYKSDDESSQIIGHFGLGFYSSFIISDYVEIDSLSYLDGAKAAHWKCGGSPDYELSEGSRSKRGTDVILRVSDNESEYLDEYKISRILETYCAFIPVPIFLNSRRVNERKPLWMERPNEIKDEDYIDFYRYLYPFEQEPIFWIHINSDYPIRAKGILYFPKLTHELDPSKGKIKFYYNSVYVSDNLKDLIPPFLMNLRGVIDCPDMPLNVSRSYLQQDPIMKKLTAHITRKVSDELSGLFKSDRKKYEDYWDDINPFIKVGMMEDDKFFEAMKSSLVFKLFSGNFVVFEDFVKGKEKVYYASDDKTQSFYINILKEQSIEVLLADSWIDVHFIPFLESKYKEIKFLRVDSELTDSSINKDGESGIVDPKTNKTFSETIQDLFKKVLDIPGLNIEVKYLNAGDVPAVVLLNEQSRRMSDMFAMFGKNDALGTLNEHTLVINASSSVIQNLKKSLSGLSEPVEDINLVIWEIYDLALMSQRSLSALRTETYVKNSIKLLEKYTAKM